jgi:hypothetical protein
MESPLSLLPLYYVVRSCSPWPPKKIWAGGMAQAVECLPSKNKALTSNPNTIKKKKKPNLIREPIWETQEPIQKPLLKILFL